MDATAFSAKYGAKPESVRIYCLMHFHEKEKYEARTAELQKEIDALKNKVKATRAKQKDIIHLVPGTAYKARITQQRKPLPLSQKWQIRSVNKLV